MSRVDKKNLKVAIVHDWLVSFAGADRVVDQIKQAFPQAVIYTLVYDKSKFPKYFQEYDVRTTYIQKIPGSAKLYKLMLTMMPKAFESLDLSEYDLVISSSSSCAKGVITRPDTLHICYCHTPTRYIWDFYYTYLNNSGFIKRRLMPGMISRMRLWDRLAADRPDAYIANSQYIANRIRKYYRRESAVIYPAVKINEMPLVPKEEYYLCVGRLTWYKRVDLAVEACTKLGKKLIVAGTGEEEKQIKSIAGRNVEFKSGLSDEEIRQLYLKARAFLFMAEEDFGIVPVEAMSAGTPVIAYGRGGATETVLDGKTGLLFHEQTVESVCRCMEKFEKEGVQYSAEEIREYSRKFSEERFRKEIEDFCMDAYEKFHAEDRREI